MGLPFALFFTGLMFNVASWFKVGSLISLPTTADEDALRQKLVGAVGAGLRGEGGGSFFSLIGVVGIFL
jgi:hypothetical protein